MGRYYPALSILEHTMNILNTNPDDIIVLNEEVEEERASLLLASFFDKVWMRLDESEPSADDYYNYM